MYFHYSDKSDHIRGVLLELRRRQQELPYEKTTPGIDRCISWKKPAYEAVYIMISNPTYAGVYTYGKRKKIIILSIRKRIHKKLGLLISKFLYRTIMMVILPTKNLRITLRQWKIINTKIA